MGIECDNCGAEFEARYELKEMSLGGESRRVCPECEMDSFSKT